MRLIDLEDNTPDKHGAFQVCIKQAFSANTRNAYADWTKNDFILVDTKLDNDEYIFGYYSE